jgi:sorting nexin-27
MPNDEITRINENINSDDSSYNSNDYTERHSQEITIPDFVKVNNKGDKFIAFNIYMSGKYLCNRRYREFEMFSSLLKREYPDFNFPSFPSKWPFKLNDQQLEVRRRALEQFLDKSEYNYFLKFLRIKI